MYNFSERLQRAMDNADKKAVDLSNETGLSQALISQYLNNKQVAKNDKISLIAEALNVSESYLAGFTDEVGTYGSENNKYGNHEENIKHLKDKPELLSLYHSINSNDTLQLLFDAAKDLTPEDLETILIHIQGIRKARGLD